MRQAAQTHPCSSRSRTPGGHPKCTTGVTEPRPCSPRVCRAASTGPGTSRAPEGPPSLLGCPCMAAPLCSRRSAPQSPPSKGRRS